MFTRDDYMKHRCSHREYYAQFVNTGTKARVLRVIGKDRLLASKDEHFNDIPLRLWDSIIPGLPGNGAYNKFSGDYYTLTVGVCLAKEAARQIKEESNDSK